LELVSKPYQREVVMQWLIVDNLPKGRRLAKWQRRAALAEDRMIFAPAAMAGNERRIRTAQEPEPPVKAT
jgi:hypothetical protein